MEILFFIAGSLSALFGTVIGAYAVFKTKRDRYEPFFPTSSKGESFNVDDDFSLVENETAEMPESVRGNSERFVRQFAENLASRKAGN
jgi:hypothetical protein